MTSGVYDGGLGEVVQEYQRLAEATAEGEPPIGYGEAANGLVQVTADNGRLNAVHIDPRALRMASDELAEALTLAVNEALADLESKYPALPLPTIDPARLQAQLEQAHQEGVRAMRRFTQSIDDAVSRFGR